MSKSNGSPPGLVISPPKSEVRTEFQSKPVNPFKTGDNVNMVKETGSFKFLCAYDIDDENKHLKF